MESGLSLSGIIAPITTPFVDDDVSLVRLAENVRVYSGTPLAGYFVLGSNGEGKSLTETEKMAVLETVAREKREHQFVIAGTGCESTRETIALSRRAVDSGADFVSLITPSYFRKRLNDAAYTRYYSDVADSLSVPVLIYNAPGFTGASISPVAVRELSAHPNIRGMKDSSGDILPFLEFSRSGFSVLAGSIANLAQALLLGAAGGVVSLADATPHPCCLLYQKIGQGEIAEAIGISLILQRLNRSVSGKYSVAGVKYAMDVEGLYGGPPRLPILPLGEEEKQEVRKALTRAAQELRIDHVCAS
jgi:4-hydroxy-2-oxoglutarate aldolase